MKQAFILSVALLPGLCEKAQDPSKGVPPAVWKLRQVMEKEPGSPEQAERFFDASEDVATWRNVHDADVFAETLYLLPRAQASQWREAERLRDLLVFLNRKEAGSVLEAESDGGPALAARKAAFLAIARLHKQIEGMTPADRVAKVLADAKGGDWNDDRLRMVWEYGAAALANDPAESVPLLKPLAIAPGLLQKWSLTTLARMEDPGAADALREFYGVDGNSPRAAAFRFWSAFHSWPDDVELTVDAGGEALTLHPVAGRARVVAKDALLKLGVEDPRAGRTALLVEGDRASVVLTQDSRFIHFRLRRQGGFWVVAR